MANNPSIYKVRIYNSSGQLVADLTGLEVSKEVTKTRNEADTLQCAFSLDKIRAYAEGLNLNVSDMLACCRNELRIYKNNIVVSSGLIQTWDRQIDAETRVITVSALGWFGLLARAYTDQDLDYSNGATDGGQIAVNLLTNAQNQTGGNLGITTGTIQTSQNQVAKYESYKNIKDAIVELSAMYNSFDFEVTWDKKFNVYYPGIGSRRMDIPILYPGNVKKLKATLDGTMLGNYIIAQGGGTGGDKLVATGSDSVSQTVYGRRTRVEAYNDINNQTMLQQRATADAALLAKPITMPEVTLDGTLGPDINQVKIGDQIRFLIAPGQDGLQDLHNNYFRVESLHWSADENNTEELALVMAA